VAHITYQSKHAKRPTANTNAILKTIYCWISANDQTGINCQIAQNLLRDYAYDA